MMDSTVPTLDAAGFDAAVGSAEPTLVVFTAPWCTTCRGTDPEVRALAADNPWSLRVRRVVVDDSPELAVRFDVRSIPSALLFRAGELIRQVQPRGAGELVAAIESELAGA
jgi:thioredoxin-like negative regulator of GroEL